MQNLIQKLRENKKIIFITILLVGAFVFGTGNWFARPEIKVLGISTHVSPTPTIQPAPTTQPLTIVNNIYLPTSVPIPSATAIPTPVPTIIFVTPVPQPTNPPTPTVLTTPTSTPTPAAQTVTIDISYAGQRSSDTYTTAITADETAWQAVQNAVGLSNIQYTDYGGSLGIFITGFNGINATANEYYDFQVNGVESNVGVSSYTVAPNDVLQFVLTSD